MVALVLIPCAASYCAWSVTGLFCGSLSRSLYALPAEVAAVPAISPPASSPRPVPPTAQVQIRPGATAGCARLVAGARAGFVAGGSGHPLDVGGGDGAAAGGGPPR